MKKIKPDIAVIIITSVILLAIFLFWHYNLGLTRYFDVDEYAHLHWTAKMLQGKRPYIDFLSFFPPGYWMSLMPAFIGGWGTTAPFLAARFLTFLVFAGMCISSSYLFYLLRRGPLFLLPAVFLAFLPLPFDKYLEIRPDSLATLLILVAVIFQIRWFDWERKVDGLLSGIFYALSLIVLPKMAPNVAVGAGIFLIFHWMDAKGRIARRIRTVLMKLKPVWGGFLVPTVILFGYLLSLGNVGLVFYSLTRLGVEANKISQWFIMMPDLFFYPNGIYYGQNGWHKGLYLNHALYLAGALMAIIRLLTPYLTSSGKRVFAEILLAAQLVVQIIFYVKIVPLKHAQYLIPIGVLVSWYSADAINLIWLKLKDKLAGRISFTIFYVALALVFFETFIFVNGMKKTWTNTEGLAKLAQLYRTIPAGEPILDLDGRFLYNPDAYYACCIPFGQFAGFLSRPLPSLTDTLASSPIKYINHGELKRVGTLPLQDQVYISSFYEPSQNPIILVRKE
jgi:hypothetical protein